MPERWLLTEIVVRPHLNEFFLRWDDLWHCALLPQGLVTQEEASGNHYLMLGNINQLMAVLMPMRATALGAEAFAHIDNTLRDGGGARRASTPCSCMRSRTSMPGTRSRCSGSACAP